MTGDLPTVSRLLLVSSSLLILYVVCHAAYNILFHPLARFPGPKLAAATRWYEYYYEIWLGGRFSDHIYALHQRYNSPIIRINPYEVHILDRHFYDQLYNFNPELDKIPKSLNNLQESPSFEVHKRRRRAFDPFFSRAAILRLEPMINGLVEKMCREINQAKLSDAPVGIWSLYRCLTTDIIMEYSLSQPMHLLDDPKRNETFVRSFVSIFKILYPMREIFWIWMLFVSLDSLPAWLVPTDQGTQFVKDWQAGLRERLKMIKNGQYKSSEAYPHPTFVEEYLKNPNLSEEEKTDERLFDNTLMFVAAGMETTGFALSTATYHVLSNSAIHQRLKAELATIMPSDSSLPAWTELEKLVYLTAVLKESLRLGVGVMTRLYRVNHHRPTQYKQWTIPPGYCISMSSRFILYDPEIFPEPKEFRPERWLQGEKSKELDKWLVTFSRGARGCIGQNLAWAEMYLTLAAVFHRFNMELYDTDRRNVDPVIDRFVPFPEKEDGVRVLVK